MKLRKSGRVLLATAASFGIGLGLTSCSPSNTIDYVFVTASKANPGQISVYRVDSESGALTQIPDSPYPSGGRNPVSAVTSPNGNNLYVANRDDNSIVQFAIGTDGKLYPQQTCNTPGAAPVSLAINSAGTLIYVADFPFIWQHRRRQLHCCHANLRRCEQQGTDSPLCAGGLQSNRSQCARQWQLRLCRISGWSSERYEHAG